MRLSTSACFVLAGAVLASCGGGASPTASPAPPPAAALASPGEVYALMDPGDGAAQFQHYAAMAHVDGLAFRALWRQLEPEDTRRDWSSLDAALDAVRAQGKKLTIHVGVSGGAWPSWLRSAGMATYDFSSPAGSGTDAVPWDPVLLDRHARLVSALAQHLQSRGDTGLVRAVSDGAPVGEMSLPGCANGMLGTVTYSRDSYLRAWKATLTSHTANFPATSVFVSAPVVQICRPDGDGAAFYGDLVADALGRGAEVTVFAADLNALGSARLGQVDRTRLGTLPIGLQTIWSSTNDPTHRMAGPLRDAVCLGMAAGARYFEVYKSDLDSADPGIQGAIDLARAGRPCP